MDDDSEDLGTEKHNEKTQKKMETCGGEGAVSLGWRGRAMGMPGEEAALNQQETARVPGNVGTEPSGVGTNYRQRGKRDRLLAMRACQRDELIIKRCVNHIVLKKTKTKDG